MTPHDTDWEVEHPPGGDFRVHESGSSARPLVIGFTGLAGSGKNTAVARLVQAHGFIRDTFADDVRKAALALDPWVPDHRSSGSMRLSNMVAQLGWDRAKTDNQEVRRILQVVGSEIGWQLHGQRCWVDRVAGRYAERLAISDVHFPHEREWLNEVGGLLVEVRRPGHQITDASTSGHVSQTLMKGLRPDVVLLNDSTITELHAKVDELVTLAPRS